MRTPCWIRGGSGEKSRKTSNYPTKARDPTMTVHLVLNAAAEATVRGESMDRCTKRGHVVSTECGKGLLAAAPPFIGLQMFLVSLLTAAFSKLLSPPPAPSFSGRDQPPPSGRRSKPPRGGVSTPPHSTNSPFHHPPILSSLAVTKETCLLLSEAESSMSCGS